MEVQDELRALKLEQLRRDIRQGFDSGSPLPWTKEEIRRNGRKGLAARASSK
jgi:antitoxin ParD1/3/4